MSAGGWCGELDEDGVFFLNRKATRQWQHNETCIRGVLLSTQHTNMSRRKQEICLGGSLVVGHTEQPAHEMNGC